MDDQHGASIRILIVDDHPVVLAGLVSMLSTQAGMSVVGASSSGDEALDVVRHTAVDVILLDLRMPGMSGIDVLHALRRMNTANTRAIILTTFEGDEDIYQAVRAGAHGYLMKNSPQSQIIAAIRAVNCGRRFFPPDVSARLAERMMRTDLTAREVEVLSMLGRGLTNNEIGRALQISSNTVRNHVNSIIEKLEVTDRTEAATVAIQRGIIHTSE